MISKDVIETAYCFFHQKLMIYERSTMEWQKEDIEYAISQYVDMMNVELKAMLSGGDNDWLHDHLKFRVEMTKAVHDLEQIM